MAERYLSSGLDGLEALSEYEAPELFASILLGSAVSPGVVTLSGHDRWKRWDIQAAKGTTGASTKLNGDDPGQFQASFFLADSDDTAAWYEFKRVVDSTVSGDTPTALPVYHPDLAANGFTEVVSAGVGGMTRDENGGVTVVVKFIEYMPPKPHAARGATPAPAGTVAGAAPPDPNAARRAEVAALYEEATAP